MSPMLIRRPSIGLYPLILGLFLAVIPGLAFAQPPGDGWQWESPFGSAPGEPPVIRTIAGGGDHAVFQVQIPGFWYRDRVGGDSNPYVELNFPGLGHLQQPGAPKLPVVEFDLAVPSNAPRVEVTEIQYDQVYQYEMQVYPTTIPERDHPEGDPEIFVVDEQIYGGQQPFPAEPPLIAPIDRNGPIPFARGQALPCTWSPRAGLLELTAEFTIAFEFPGSPLSLEPPTLERIRFAEALFDNWDYVESFFPPNLVEFEGAYLFVYPEEHREALAPLIDQKKARGYLVNERTVESTDGTCSGIRDAIGDWLGGTPYQQDHYCLLVGDTDQIPLCTSPSLPLNTSLTAPTDDLYASPSGDDLDEEVYLGRLSFDSFGDLSDQVTKILRYEDDPALFIDYAACGLVAHRQNAPGKYVGAHESVRTASYSTSPTFTTFYGSDGATNNDVSNYIEENVGLVAYRGHGSDEAWTGWNNAFQDYDVFDVAGLGALAATPVIWSFACNNAELDHEDCLAEVWLESDDSGAVAHYGSTIPSYTVQNHELDRAMFRAVWNEGLVTHAMAVEYAEARMATLEGSDNAWMYLLLGDPEMKIRRHSPPSWTLVTPQQVPTCEGPGCELQVLVYDELGRPLENVIVSAWKPAGAGGNKALDEVLVNRYTDRGGQATLPVAPSSEGTLRVVARDLDGNSFETTIPVVDGGTAVPGSGDGTLLVTARPSVTDAGTSFRFSRAVSQATDIELFDVRGRQIRVLEIGPAKSAVSWDGRDAAGRNVPSGTYIARIGVEGRTLTTRVMVVR